MYQLAGRLLPGGKHLDGNYLLAQNEICQCPKGAQTFLAYTLVSDVVDLIMQVFERDLAVFGFFATLGRSTRAYLAAKGVSDSEESLSSLLR